MENVCVKDNGIQKITLMKLLDDYSILIPALQRNYVHGRDDVHAKEVREHFVESLKKCCCNHEEMNLDVVYGVLDHNGVLVPIDGQQRLTTLWLSAVYAAVKLEKCDERRAMLAKLSRFSYEARPLASTFCRWLTSGAVITDFNASLAQAEDCWGEDPTVQAMITTLRLIDSDLTDKAKKLLPVRELLAVIKDRIYFNFSEVHGNDSDLYVKINARGKLLTQWENFKGAFASKLTNENRNYFEQEIEKCSDKYFNVLEATPDQAFFALFARLADYVLRTSMSANKPFKEEKHNNLSVLAESKVDVNQTYVPIEEFGLDDGVAAKIRLPVLRMIHWALENDAPFTYWDGTKKIADAVFFPQNANERDFSLFLYEYFSIYDEGKALEVNNYRALRLVANVLENVARQQKEKTSSDHFNRIKILRQFLQKSAGLYASNVELDKNTYMQCVEEKVKAELYEKYPECVALVQNCEKLMRGRTRIALLDAKDKQWKIDIEDGQSLLAQNFKNRLERIQVKLEAWNIKDARRKLLVELIQHMPWDIAWNSVVPVNLEDPTYRIILSNDEFAPWLQSSLVDQSVEPNVWFDPQREYGRGTYAVDWRESLCKFIRGDVRFENENVADKNDSRRVRRHDSTYYLYTKTNNPRSFPIGDWRIGYYLDDSALRKTLSKWCPFDPIMQMNYSGELVFEIKSCKGLYVHLWAQGIAVEFVREGQRSGIRLVELTRIKDVGYCEFFKSVTDLFSSKPEELFQALQANSLPILLFDCTQ